MHFPDMSTYVYACETPQVGVRNVGWLSSAHDYSRGACPEGFLSRLEQLALSPVNLFRGSHLCEFCPPPEETTSPSGLAMLMPREGTTGNGEIRVAGRDGAIYAAPVLIAHYVREHGYLPPEPFIEAVFAGRRPEVDDQAE